MMQGSGFLAIWSDLAPDDETDWSHWITREHAAERVGIDGFLACRIFRSVGTVASRYLILYELESSEVVGWPQYLERLNSPTPWSQTTMPRLRNFARGGGRVVATAGTGQGGLLAALPLNAKPEWDASALTAEVVRLDRIVAVRVLLTDAAQTSIQTREKGMRKQDDSFAGLLLIEGLDQASLRRALWQLRSLHSSFATGSLEDLPIYELFFSLPKRLLPS